MAQIGGPYSSFEKRTLASLKPLEERILYRENRITQILLTAYNRPKANAAYWTKVRKQLSTQYRILKSLYRTYMSKSLPVAYRASVRDLVARLSRNKTVAGMATKTTAEIVAATKSKDIVRILYRDAITDWLNALNAGQTNLIRMTRRTQQTLISESLIDKTIISAIQSGNLMNNTYLRSINLSGTLAGQLKDVSEVIGGKFYVQAGKRRFSPKYYAEMVTRVKFHEAQAYASIETATAYGTSLVQVSSHNTQTKICMPHEGKIYSIDGKDKRFPQLVSVPPYHVNCLHLLMPMFIESMEADKTLQQWEDFSNGRISRPPVPASFVPISERESA